MTTVDPMVRAFVDAVGVARSHATKALGTLDAIKPGSDGAASAVRAVSAQVDAYAFALNSARLRPSTVDAAEGARELALGTTTTLLDDVDALRAAVSGVAGGTDDAAAVVARVGDLRTQLNRVVHWELDELVRQAADPLPGADMRVGVIEPSGTWRPVEPGSVETQLRELADELSRLEGGSGGVGGDLLDAPSGRQLVGDESHFDEQIGLDAFDAALGRAPGAAALDDVGHSAAARFRSALDAAQAMPAGRAMPDGVAPPRANSMPGPGTLPTVGAGEVRSTTPTADEVLGTMAYGPSTSIDNLPVPAVDVPLVATGEVHVLPSYDAAIAAARGDSTGAWVVQPRADGSWIIAEVVRPASRDGRTPADAAAISGTPNAFRQEGTRVDAFVSRGRVTSLVERREPRAVPELSPEAFLAKAHTTGTGAVVRVGSGSLGLGGLPEVGTPLLRIARPGSGAPALELTAGGYPPTHLYGARSDALDHARLRAADFGSPPAAAVVLQLEPGHYAVVPASAARGEGAALEAALADLRTGSIGPGDDVRVEAVFAPGGTQPGLDLRTGATID